MATRSIHVAGVIDLAEAQLLINCGVRYVGFPFVLDHHKEDLTTDAAAAIVSELGSHATFFLITYLNRAGAILELCQNTFDPVTGASGATGRVHDWEISRRLVASSARPLILAGGLNAGNVRQAIRTVRPAGVDVHTGIEGDDGRKRYDLTRRFVEEAQVGFSDLELELDVR